MEIIFILVNFLKDYLLITIYNNKAFFLLSTIILLKISLTINITFFSFSFTNLIILLKDLITFSLLLANNFLLKINLTIFSLSFTNKFLL